MKTPPFVLGITLVFWGWQTDFLIPGIIMGAVLEGSRFAKVRWDLSDDDFKRIWTFCALLFLAAAVYAFADNGAVEGIGRFLQGPNLASEHNAGVASARTAGSLIRWLPMIFFLFAAAQAFSIRQEVPVHVISLILQRRWKQAKKLGKPLPATRGVDVAYPYFALCLFASSVHRNQNNYFFWGLCLLLGWVLWVRRPKRFNAVIWLAALALAILFGYSGARGLMFFQRYVDSFNVQMLAQFFGRNRTDPSQSETQIGKIGAIKTSTRIVIRLQPKSGSVPAYLREASYRMFRSPSWFANRSRLDFIPVDHAVTNENTWLLGISKTNMSRLGISCYLQERNRNTGNSMGLLPLPTGSAVLENLSAYVLQKNRLGAALAEGPGFVQFDALYGPGATIDTPPVTNFMGFFNSNWEGGPRWGWGRPSVDTNGANNPEEFGFHNTNRFRGTDLQVPTNEIAALESVVAELGLRNQTRDQAVQSISKFFATKFTYRMWQDDDNEKGKDETPMGRFLLKTRAGHCEYFATATVLLLREIGIPARYAVGYSVHEAGMDGFVVRQRDAHAWCLVWNGQKQLWEDFDTTPVTWFDIESRHSGGSVWASDLWWWVEFQFSKFRTQTHLRQYILIGLIPVLALLLFQIARQRRRRQEQGTAGKLTAWPGLDSEFYAIENQLAQRGFPRQSNEPLADWLERAVKKPSLEPFRDSLNVLLRLHYRYRFDPKGLSEADREELRQRARECLEQLSQTEKEAAAVQ